MRFPGIFLFLPCILAQAQVPRADVFVSPKGNDSWSGKLPEPNAARSDGPFASVARAQAAVRDLVKAKPDQARTVMLREGTYYLPLSPTEPGTLSFNAVDSGAAGYPVTWRNYPGEKPAISGAQPIGKGAWKHAAGALWQTQLPAATQPFESLFYNGERRFRARVASARGVGYYMRGGACYSTATGKAVAVGSCGVGTYLKIAAEVPAKGENAGCPAIANASHPSTAKCLDRFVYDAADPIANWINLNPNDTACPAAPAGSVAAKYPVGDIEVTMFNASTVDVLRVSCVDTAKHMIYFTANSRGDSVNYAAFGPAAGRRYIVENARDAFDAASKEGQTGIWFLDRSATPWTLNYLAKAGENPNNATVAIPQVQAARPMGGSLISGLYLNYVTFSGIAFEMDSFVPPPTGFNNDETSGDTLPEAIDCVSCKHILFDGVTLRHTAASGIRVTSGSGDIDQVPTDLKIVNSAFYDIGDCGVRIGSHPRVGDRWNHVVQYVTVENTIVQGYGRVFPGGAGISLSNGHDATFLHNDITDGYHSGISVCLNGCGAHDGDGYNILAKYNHVWNVMQGVMSDGGGIYFNVGDRAGSGIEDKVFNNLIHDIAGYEFGGNGIYLDNQSAAMDVDDNVVYRVTGEGVAVKSTPAPGMRENRFRNNILGSAEPTNDTVKNAGRANPNITVPKVAATFPVFPIEGR